MAPELKIFRGEPQGTKTYLLPDSILELQSEAAPFHRGAVRVLCREMEPFQAGPLAKDVLRGQGLARQPLEPPAVPQAEGYP